MASAATSQIGFLYRPAIQIYRENVRLVEKCDIFSQLSLYYITMKDGFKQFLIRNIAVNAVVVITVKIQLHPVPEAQNFLRCLLSTQQQGSVFGLSRQNIQIFLTFSPIW